MSTARPSPHPVADPNDEPPAAASPLRLSQREPVSTAGFIDAAWWPYSRDLTRELPQLLAAFWSAGREITRVTYNVTAWDPAPRRTLVAGRRVRLGGFATSDPRTIRLSDAWGHERIDVLALDPDTPAAVAERVFALVAEAGNADRAVDLLRRAGAQPDSSRSDAAAVT